jgi:hypothetical protein
MMSDVVKDELGHSVSNAGISGAGAVGGSSNISFDKFKTMVNKMAEEEEKMGL